MCRGVRIIFVLRILSKYVTCVMSASPMIRVSELYELEHSISYKIACVSSEDSDEPSHPRNLIIVFAGLSVERESQSVLRRTTKTLIILRRCAGFRK